MNIHWDLIRRIAVGTFCLAAAAGSISGYLQGAAGEEAAVLYAAEERTAVYESAAPYAQKAAEEEETLLDLNTATEEELCTLKGIGPAKARAICEYREAYGGFVCIEEIMEVRGIGEGIFGKIRNDICVGE